jgi:hypothetical protein
MNTNKRGPSIMRKGSLAQFSNDVANRYCINLRCVFLKVYTLETDTDDNQYAK